MILELHKQGMGVAGILKQIRSMEDEKGNRYEIVQEGMHALGSGMSNPRLCGRGWKGKDDIRAPLECCRRFKELSQYWDRPP